jgi:hypothetical protein
MIQYKPGRWWRVLRNGQLWSETSDEEEARSAMKPGDKLQRLYYYEATEWRDEEWA